MEHTDQEVYVKDYFAQYGDLILLVEGAPRAMRRHLYVSNSVVPSSVLTFRPFGNSNASLKPPTSMGRNASMKLPTSMG
jgi:hypothetical protein